jgi:hypothetical protein
MTGAGRILIGSSCFLRVGGLLVGLWLNVSTTATEFHKVTSYAKKRMVFEFLDQRILTGTCNCLGSILDPQFAQDIGNVFFGGGQ